MKEKTWHRISSMNQNRPSEGELEDLYEYTSMALDYYATTDLFRSLQEMSVKTITLLLPEGKTLSKDVATILTKEYSSGFGFAVATEDEPGVDVARGLGEVSSDKLVALTEGNKDNKLLLWMIKSEQTLQESDLQPFWLVEGEMVACLEGDFSGWAQDGSSDVHTNEYHACEKRIKPKMIKLWKSNDSDATKFKEAMKDTDDDTLEQMFDACPDNASVVYLTAQGLSYAANKPEEREVERPWGWEYAGTTQAVDQPASNPNKKKVMLSLSDDKTTSDSKIDKTAEKTDLLRGKFIDVKTKIVKHGDRDFPFELANKQDGISSIDVDDSGVCYPPPAEADTKEKLDAWYKKELGYRPSNWRRRPWIMRKNSATAVKLADLQNGTATAALQTAAPTKDTSNKFVPSPKIMQRTVAEHFLNVEYPKIVGNNSEFIANPDAIFKNEEKDPSAAAMMNDKRFISIKDFDMPHAGRCFLLSHIAGPASESYIALFSAIWRDNMLARISAERKNEELTNRITSLEKDRDDALKLAAEGQASTAKTSDAPASKKKVFALK